MKNGSLLIFVLLFIFTNSLFAQNKTWIGGATGMWNVDANWSPSGVPGASNTVVIDGGASVTLNQ